MIIFLRDISLFLFPPLLVGTIHICWMKRGNMSIYKKILIFIMYLILINICTFSFSYVRGVKEFNFEHMTVSYRLKYIGLGCVLGLAPLTMIKFGNNKVQKIDEKLQMKKRYSNFDLLKIISVAMIVLFHYAYGKWDYSSMGNYKLVMDIIWMFGELGVNCFALISGYFMIEQKKPFKVKKICCMWLQVMFYSILSTTIVLKFVGGGATNSIN